MRYDIAVVDPAGGPRRCYGPWDAQELAKEIRWLKRMNALGREIYLRPAEPTGVVLVPGLPAAAVEQMKREGFAPAVVTEVRPGEQEAWVRLSAEPLPAAEARPAAQALAQRYGSQAAVGEEGGYGRLAGFRHQQPGARSAYVWLREAAGRIAAQGRALLQQIRADLHQRLVERERQARRARLSGDGDPSGSAAVRAYSRQARALLAQRPGLDDPTMDRTIARALAAEGFTGEAIKAALREASPHLADRQAPQVEDYLERTARQAVESAGRSRDLGWDR